MVDELYKNIQRFSYEVLLTTVPEESAMRYLISILRIIPELERSGDLAEHIARRALQNVTAELTPRMRGIIAQMGEIGLKMWMLTADDFADHECTHQSTVESLDDELDDLQVALVAELASGGLPIPVTIELALIARFYERFGDHAVNLGRTLRELWMK
jgi:phosphate transport system protein